MKNIAKILFAIIILFALFYVFFIIPNDKRINPFSLEPKVSARYEELSFDFTKNISQAKIQVPELAASGKLLDKYPYKQDYPGLHNGPLNMHVSLGWFPLKTVHRDCIFAPAPSEFEFNVTLPENPVLKFDYGIISSVEGHLLSGASFIVTVADEEGKTKTVFEAFEKPLKPYFWNYYDSLYKNFIKYFKPGLADHNGKWNYAEVNLSEYASKTVRITLTTKTSSGRALAFWGKPCIFSRQPSGTERQPSVILIVIDSFKRGHMRPEYSPVLCQMASEGVDFKRALSNGNNTKLSVYSFMSSRYPFEMPETATHYDLSKAEKESFYKRAIPTIPSMFAANGYRTAGIGSVSLFCDGHGLSGDIGFDEAENLEQSGYSPPHVTEEAIKWLNRHGNEKFFLLVYYYGPHGPYRPPLRYLWKALRSGKYDNLRDALYSGDIIYHDDYVKMLKQYLQSSPAFKDTIVVVTADHGLAFRSGVYDWPTRFGEWKKKTVWFHSHGVSITPDDLNVPLVFWNINLKKTIERKVQLLDLGPTLAELTGIVPPAEFKGQSLLGLMKGKDFSEGVTFHQGVTNRGVYWKDEYLYIDNFKPREGFPKETVVPEELYNIQKDSACLENLAFIESPLLTKMRGFYEAVLVRDEENRIVFNGPAGSTATIYVSAEGNIDIADTKAVIRDRTKRSFTVELKNGDTFSFSMVPAQARLYISGDIDGVKLKPSDILYGSSAIAINASLEITPEDRVYYKGLPDNFNEDKIPVLLFGIFAKDNVSQENLKNSPKQLKSMLEQWGYIN